MLRRAAGSRRNVPRAGLLGSLAAIALVLISFLPLLEILNYPLVGFIALSIVLTALIGRVPLPGRIPGTLGALIVAGGLFYLLQFFGVPGYTHGAPIEIETTWFPQLWMDAFNFAWVAELGDAMSYLPIVLPFALATVVGGIDCTESAAAAGDEYPTGTIIFGEAIATLVAGLCGGVIQTTPYIGHPAYKRMGGRALYTLLTALLIGSAGVVGYFATLYEWIPIAAVYPILVFIGLEITAQSFAATPKAHYGAVAIACIPALAVLVESFTGQIFGDPKAVEIGLNANSVADPELSAKLSTIRMLSNGFILTSLLWASILAASIDWRLQRAAALLVITAVLTIFGLVHSPLPGAQIFLPWGPESVGNVVLPAEFREQVFHYAGGYLLAALALFGWSYMLAQSGEDKVTITSEDHEG